MPQAEAERLARGLRSGLAVARCRGGGRVVPRRRALARRAGFHLDHRRPWPAGRRSRRRCAQTLARTKPANFRIPPKRTPPRRVSRAGTECIEAIFEFETAFGPANGIRAPRPRWPRPAARLDVEHQPARNPRPRRRIQAPRGTATRRATSAPKLARPARQGSAPLPTAIRRCWSWAAARPGSRSRRGCISSASIR